MYHSNRNSVALIPKKNQKVKELKEEEEKIKEHRREKRKEKKKRRRGDDYEDDNHIESEQMAKMMGFSKFSNQKKK
jgi:U4/U6.U5 tri-snRNP component SNU23